MDKINSDEAWRFIPPEEKIELMAKAHSKGVFAAVLGIVLGATCAAALEEPWLLWSTLIGSPFVFQFASGRAWRNLKPSLTLRYLAARSATRRCAFAAEAEDLSVKLMFRGELEITSKSESAEERILSQRMSNGPQPVWIALFSDTLVVISESRGGAILELAHPIDQNLKIYRPNGEENSLAPSGLYIEMVDHHTNKVAKLSSQFPAALTVFEKKYQEFKAHNKAKDNLMKKGRAMGLKFDDLYDEESSNSASDLSSF